MATKMVCLATVIVAIFLARCDAPKSKLLDAPIVAELKQGGDQGARTFDHSRFDALLREHVDEAWYVDYGGLAEDSEELDVYLKALETVALQELSRDEQLALLINAYNAFTLRLILDHRPDIESIKDIDDPWGKQRFTLGGHRVSLDEIEHGLIRPLFKDPRIHFAVNCAAVGCPPLARTAYTGQNIEAQLDQAARRALGSPRWARLENGTLQVTKVMDWYGEDFVSPEWKPRADSIAEWVARHGPDEVRRAVDGGAVKVRFMDYDWRLNDARSQQQ